MALIGFSCTCGQVRGHVDVPSPRAGNHCYCHCPDCRAAALYFGVPDPAPNGVQIWQTSLDRLHVTKGLDQIARFQLGPKGVFRWYAACCNTQLTTSLRPRRLPLGGILADRLDHTSALGSVVGHVFMANRGGGYRHKGLTRMGLRTVAMMGHVNLTGAWRDTPFRDADGAPIGPARILSRDERTALMKL